MYTGSFACPTPSPLPSPSAGLSRGSPDGFRRALVQVEPAPPCSQRATGQLDGGRGGRAHRPKVSRSLPQLFQSPRPIIRRPSTNKTTDSPAHPVVVLHPFEAVKARDQTGGNSRHFCKAITDEQSHKHTSRPSLVELYLCASYTAQHASPRPKVKIRIRGPGE